jgi:hypothetical protein
MYMDMYACMYMLHSDTYYTLFNHDSGHFHLPLTTPCPQESSGAFFHYKLVLPILKCHALCKILYLAFFY